MATARTLTAVNFLLTLEGVTCGYIQSVAGGDVFADVLEEATGGTSFVKKHVGQPKYEDITVEVGLGMAQPFNDWIAASWQANYLRKDGSVTIGDATFKAQSELDFVHALITETTIPALDATAKAAGRLTIKLSPELTRFRKASSAMLPPAAAQKQPKFLTSGFRLELDGLDCRSVRKIDSFAVQVRLSDVEVGDARGVETAAARIEFPNLRVTLSDGPTAATWQTWLDDFVVKGNNGDGQEKGGAIVFLSPDAKELGRVVLHNVGILALRHAPQVAGAESVPTRVADLYCERMELQIGKQAPAPPAPKVIDEPLKVVDPGKTIGIRR